MPESALCVLVKQDKAVTTKAIISAGSLAPCTSEESDCDEDYKAMLAAAIKEQI